MWGGAFTSSVGTWMQEVAQNWLILTMTGSAFLLGLDAFLGDAPYMVFSLFGGVLADRMDRRRILLGSQFVQMASAALLVVLVLTGAVHVWMILVLSFVVGCAQSFGGPAYMALVPTLVDRGDLPNAVALNSIQFNLARVIGPVLAGVAFYKLGAAGCFGLNALSFLAPVAALLLLRRGGFASAPSTEGVFASLKRGLTAVRDARALRGLIVLSFVGSFCAMPLVTFLPVFARSVFHRDARGYSVLLAAFGVGAIVGAFGVAAFGNVRRKGALAVAMQMFFGALMAGVRALADAGLSYVAPRAGGRGAHGRLRALHDPRPVPRRGPPARPRRLRLLARVPRRDAARQPRRRRPRQRLHGAEGPHRQRHRHGSRRSGRVPRAAAQRAGAVGAERAPTGPTLATRGRVGILQGIIAWLRRSVGKFLQAIFGWAVRALFGTVEKSERTLLSVIVGAAAAWPLLLLGIPFPRLAAIVLALVPIPKSISPGAIRIGWIVLAALVPVAVGIALARRGTAREADSAWKTALSGFPVTVAIAAAFATAFVTAPIRRLIALARRQSDVTVPLLLKKEEYAPEARAIAKVLRGADFDLTRDDPPGLLTAPSRVLSALGGERLRRQMPRDLHYYRSDTLDVTIVPNGVTLQGKEKAVARAHALVCEKATLGPGLQTISAAAQAIEKRLKDVWRVFGREPAAHESSSVLRSGIDDVTRRLGETDLSFDDWQVLYREILQVSRAIEGEPQLLASQEETMSEERQSSNGPVPSGSSARNVPPRPWPPAPERRVAELSTPQLVAGLTGELRELIARELELARTEVRIDLKAELKSARWLGIAAVLALSFLNMLFVAGALFLARWLEPPFAALAVAGGLLVFAVVFGLVGKAALVKPLETTRQTLSESWSWAKNRIA